MVGIRTGSEFRPNLSYLTKITKGKRQTTCKTPILKYGYRSQGVHDKNNNKPYNQTEKHTN